jgi:hypothetical protein
MLNRSNLVRSYDHSLDPEDPDEGRRKRTDGQPPIHAYICSKGAIEEERRRRGMKGKRIRNAKLKPPRSQFCSNLVSDTRVFERST